MVAVSVVDAVAPAPVVGAGESVVLGAAEWPRKKKRTEIQAERKKRGKTRKMRVPIISVC